MTPVPTPRTSVRASLLLLAGALTSALLLPTAAMGAVPGAVPAGGGEPLVGTALAAPGASARGAVEEDPDAGLPVVVAVDSLTPAVVGRSTDLTVTVTLRNTGSAVITTPRVLVSMDKRRGFISRTSLDRWRDADPQDPVGTTVLTVELPTPLAPGASTTVALTVPAAQLSLGGASTWGPRGLAVVVADGADPARPRLGVARTFALWFPEQEVTATRVSVLAPVVGPAVDPYSTDWVTDLDALVQPAGRLGALLDATADHPSVTWAIDPWLVEVTDEAAPTTAGEASGTDGQGTDPEGTQDPGTDGESADAGEDPGTDEGTGTEESAGAEESTGTEEGSEESSGATPTTPAASPQSVAWATSLLRATTDREVVLLPYGDADAAALVHTRHRDLLGAAIRRSEGLAATTDLPDGAKVSLVWPADTTPDLATAAAAGARSQALLVGPGALPAPAVLTYTPTGRATVGTAQGDVTVLVPDGRLSDALRTGWVGTGRDDEPTERTATQAAQLTPATAAQDLLAELAVITRERPSDGRHLLLTVPRDWEPDADVVDAQLAALESAPWVRPESLAALVGATDPGVDRGTLPDREVADGEVGRAEVDAMAATVDERRGLAQLVDDPASLLGDLEAEVLAPLSVAWRADPAGRAAVVTMAQGLAQALRDAVGVEPVGDLNLIARSGEFPVRVTNSLDQPVTVVVGLRPGDARLVPEKSVEVTIPAQGEERVLIPVHAVQSADVEVAVEVRTAQGVLVDDSTVFQVRVRADWEGIGTAVIGALLALGVVIGLIRTIRRGRTARRSAPVVTAGPDALSPEEEEEAAEAARAEASSTTGSAAGTGRTTHEVSP